MTDDTRITTNRWYWNFLSQILHNDGVRSEYIRNEIHTLNTTDAPCDLLNYAVGADAYLPTANGTITAYAVGGEEDTATTGTGAWYLNIQCLDEDHVEFTQSKALNGTSAVTFDTQGMRVNRAWVGQCGTSGTNVRQIIIAHDGTPFFGIYPSHGRGWNAFTVPAGYTGYVTDFTCGVRADKSAEWADIHLRLRQTVAPLEGWQHIGDNAVSGASQFRLLISGEPVRMGTILKTQTHEISTNGLSLYANYRVFLYPSDE